MDQARWRFRIVRRLLLGVAVLVGAASGVPALAGLDETTFDWRAADRARFRQDMRAAARRLSEGAARERRDAARSRREARLRADDLRREVRELAAERRAQMRRLRLDMQNSMRELKQSLRTQRWRCRSSS